MVDKKGKKSAEDVAADMKKIQKLRNPKKNAKDYDPGVSFCFIYFVVYQFFCWNA